MSDTEKLKELERRIEKLEEWAHEPFDFTKLVQRIERLEAALPTKPE
jgi:chromosome segregation ATPase